MMAYNIRMDNNQSGYSYDLSDLSAGYSQDVGCITAYWRPVIGDCTPPSCDAELQRFCMPYGAVEEANESWDDLLFLMKVSFCKPHLLNTNVFTVGVPVSI
jgi:hypothetical protein